MERTLAIRTHDLPLLGGCLLSLLLLTGLAAAYGFLFRRLQPASRLGRALQARLRTPALLVVALVPTLNFAYWVPGLRGVAGELLEGLGLAGLVLGIEATLAFLFDYLPTRGGRAVPTLLPVALRWLLYPFLLAVYLGRSLDVRVLELELFRAASWLLLVFVLLHVVYRFLFRTVAWRHPLARTLRDRLRLWAYLLVLLLTFAYGTTWVPDFPLAWDVLLQQSLGTLGAILVLETLLAVVFEFYFPEVRRVTVPHLFQDLTRALSYLALGVLVLGVVFKRDLSSLLVGSTVLSVILGLALQETLGNFFAGLSLGLSKPYNLGDHVEVSGLSGRVEKIDWRSTALRTSTGDYTVLPNSVLAKEKIQNFSAPTSLHARHIDVGVHYRHPPSTVRRVVLEAVATVAEAEREPEAEVWLMRFGDSSVDYRVRYWIQDYGRRFQVDSAVREALWYHFTRHGIEIPFPIRTLHHHRAPSSKDLEGEVQALLDQVDFLRSLEPSELRLLAHRTRLQLYAAGERVFSQGDPGETFYLIKEGRLRVTARNAEGEVFLVKEMLPGQFFGEMALLTGEPRSATVEAVTDAEVLALDKGALRELLRMNPNADRIISEKLATRQLNTVRAREELETEKARTSPEHRSASAAQVFEQLSEQFLRQIREFFSY